MAVLNWCARRGEHCNLAKCPTARVVIVEGCPSPPCPFGRPTEWAPYATVGPVSSYLAFPALRFSRGGRSVLVTAVTPFSGERSAFVTAVAPYSGERAALVILEGGGSFCSGCLWVVSRCRFEASMGSYPFE
ncbi:BnaA09g06850D [Brassica napus]|uniref:BnaA09g06850D protein n=1 Tax=Brassica napus TaxID=3708 RepID=A0A078FWA0_BRANA|nr:BnaA09g06850D [Brassica napus]